MTEGYLEIVDEHSLHGFICTPASEKMPFCTATDYQEVNTFQRNQNVRYSIAAFIYEQGK